MKKTGRPSRDYEALFLEWVRSAKSVRQFLISKDIKPVGTTWNAVKGWPQRLAEMSADMKATLHAHTGARDEVTAAPVVEKVDVAAEIRGKESVADVAPKAIPAMWQMVEQWRSKQAVEDYRTADTARAVVRLLLKSAIVKVKKADGSEAFEASMKPHEVRQLTQAMADIQRVQRLALGLSTENVGVDGPRQAETHVEKDVTPKDEPIPTFEVEMSSRGRFLRPRPRRVG